MTELTIIADIVVAALVLIGAGLTLAGSLGLLKLSDPISRLHAPTLAATLGLGTILMASIVNAFATGAPSLHEVLVMAFLFVTAPITANFIAKVHIHRCRDNNDIPPPPADKIWATQSDT